MQRSGLPTLDAVTAAVTDAVAGLDFAPTVIERADDPVTELDRLIDLRLGVALPQLASWPILSEESKGVAATPPGWCWVVDPIDGTHNLVAGTGEYGVSVALMDLTTHTAELAVCHLPVSGVTYSAQRGEGAFVHRRRMPLIDPTIDRHLVALGYPAEAYRDVERAVELPRSLMASGLVLRQSGSAMYDICRVATGRLLGFVEIGVRLWDVAAADLVATECGAASVWYCSRSPDAAPDAIDYAVGATAAGLRRITTAAGLLGPDRG